MNQEHTAAREAMAKTDSGDITLIDMLIAVAKHKKLIIGLPFAVAVLAAAISLALPDEYKASTKLLPPQQSQSGAAALLAQIGGVAGLAGGAAGIKSPNELYVGMLKSRTIADSLIEKFKLKEVYSTRSQETARSTLEVNTVITSGKDGLITIEVEDQNKKLVANLANGYVEELFRLSKSLAVTEASQRRVFFERQLEVAKNNLVKAEVALKRDMGRNGVISVDSESRAILETVARLTAQVSAKEIELNSMRAFLTTSHPDFRRAEEELSSLRSELSKLENGRGRNSASSAEVVSDKGGLNNIQLLRDLKYYQMLYELLAKQYEVARLDEAKEPSIVQVLDPAMEPERKSKPKRAIIVVLSAMASLVLAIFWAILSEAKRKAMRLPTVAARWGEFRTHLRFRNNPG